MIADEVERIAEQLARKGFGPAPVARMGIAATLAAALDDPETPPYALAAMSRELRALITNLPAPTTTDDTRVPQEGDGRCDS